MRKDIWTPNALVHYDRYRVRAKDGAMPMVVLRLDGWQVGERWCLSTQEACDVLNTRGATPITGPGFRRGSGEAGHDGLDMTGKPQRFNIEVWPRTTIQGGGQTSRGTFYAIMDGPTLNDDSGVVCITQSEKVAEDICRLLNNTEDKRPLEGDVE